VTINADGTVDYLPDEEYNVTDTVTDTVTKEAGDTETATVTVTVDPVVDIADDTATATEDTPVDIPVLDNDSFGPDASVTDVSDPTNGSVTINADGTVTYEPDPDFNGTDTFTYTVTTPGGVTETATVTVTVDPVVDIADDAATVNEDTPVDIPVLDNDSFGPDAAVTDVSDPANGSVT
ncbi:MAG: Ig-like domain-containing protein, partial [Cyanobacteria bacterium J06639_14]